MNISHDETSLSVRLNEVYDAIFESKKSKRGMPLVLIEEIASYLSQSAHPECPMWYRIRIGIFIDESFDSISPSDAIKVLNMFSSLHHDWSGLFITTHLKHACRSLIERLGEELVKRDDLISLRRSMLSIGVS